MKKLLITLIISGLSTSHVQAMQMETAKTAKKENSCADTCCRVAKGCCYLGAAYLILTASQEVMQGKQEDPNQRGGVFPYGRGHSICESSGKDGFLIIGCPDPLDKARQEKKKCQQLFDEEGLDYSNFKHIKDMRIKLNDPDYEESTAAFIQKRNKERKACKDAGIRKRNELTVAEDEVEDYFYL